MSVSLHFVIYRTRRRAAGSTCYDGLAPRTAHARRARAGAACARHHTNALLHTASVCNAPHTSTRSSTNTNARRCAAHADRGGAAVTLSLCRPRPYAHTTLALPITVYSHLLPLWPAHGACPALATSKCPCVLDATARLDRRDAPPALRAPARGRRPQRPPTYSLPPRALSGG